MAELILNHISKAYSEQVKGHMLAVDNISFTVQENEFMVMVGPSGCGKSTILRMIAGLEDITEGDLLLDGKRINEVSPKDRDIAMVFQNYALYPHMTVYDNMAFGLKLKHYSKSEIKERVMQTAQLLEIEEMLHRKPKMLSGGQRQRVAIGRAIIRRPKVFLFDEPLSNLDAKLRTQMRIELQKLHRSINVTMIYVTHDQTEAMTLGDRIAVLNKGKLMQLDTPLKLYNSPVNKFVAGFIGSPAMNFIRGTLRNMDGFCFIPEPQNEPIFLGQSIDPALTAYVDLPIRIGIRPEHVHILDDADLGSDTHCSASIMAYENMGNEQLVYFTTADNTIIIRRPPVEKIELGKIKRLYFQTDKIIWFDGKTDQVIEPQFATFPALV